MAEKNMNLWNGSELVLEDVDYEARKAYIAAQPEDVRKQLVPKSLDWRPEFDRARTLVSGHLRRNPAHDGGGVKLEIKCYNSDVEVAQEDIKHVWDLIRNGAPAFQVYDRGHKVVVTFREVVSE